MTFNPRDIEQQVYVALSRSKKGSPLRRRAFDRLLGLTRAPESAAKSLAAQKIPVLFSDFPELAEEAINAIYDLCEDLDPEVRMSGYKSLVHISEVDCKLVKRNTDVLVQLLQCDEPREASVVKDALCRHLDFDPVVTFSVLCDQMTPHEQQSMDGEQENQHLRELVIRFLAQDARNLIRRHADDPGSESESIMAESLSEAIVRPPTSDSARVLVDLMLSMSYFRREPSRGRNLLIALMRLIDASLDTSSTSASMQATFDGLDTYFELAETVSLQKRLASPSELLRFCLNSLVRGDKLKHLPRHLQLSAAGVIARALDESRDELRLSSEMREFHALRDQAVDGCLSLLEVFTARQDLSLKPADLKSLRTLIGACKARSDYTSWKPSPVLKQITNKLLQVKEVDADKALVALVKSLASEPQPLPLDKPQAPAHGPSSLPQKPSGPVRPPAKRPAPTSDEAESSRGRQQAPHLDDEHRHKKLRSGADAKGQPVNTPAHGLSLLSRMTPSSPSPSPLPSLDSPAPTSHMRGARKQADITNPRSMSDEAPQSNVSANVKTRNTATGHSASGGRPFSPVVGFSIKGAAGRELRDSGTGSGSASPSLLERVATSSPGSLGERLGGGGGGARRPGRGF
ncbi:hypothetical protein CONPUDRAFT_164439 [Coniophora puteana RWD-64-598 SS2]|uniref:ARM repeat-containing protein n=1 Tax=Coniophora puteana (strain RWD-64-598) TaxID=741705 RepID=A0A5M3MWI1_CONPW|nr:uncharacterized protein CONPUDRAFT_164439 [Coniophora puteana RWD-64-598 SS2]EIW83512.1 hypothetical protein CONPUDRAFT_164439 [Coniophora puteana RWD-64-598 SS2]